MDDLTAKCHEQLSSFRIKELKDVLTRLGLPRKGRKQVLMERIMTLLLPSESQPKLSNGKASGRLHGRREEAARVIDDIFRKLRGSATPDLASQRTIARGKSGTFGILDDQDETTHVPEGRIQCPCGVPADMDTMIQCDNRTCGVWQHVKCVILPVSQTDGEPNGDPEIPHTFYCDLCRISRADPFCVSLSHMLVPTLLNTSVAKVQGSTPMQTVEKTFILSRRDRELLYQADHDIQVWCILMNDKVPYRMHWPAYADVRINGFGVRVTNRPGTQLLGDNGRDDGASIASCVKEGTNRISLSAYDARPFCIGVRLIRRLTIQEVLSMIPHVSEGEPFEEALSRLRRCIGGGGAVGTADDDDSDLQVVADSVTMNLRCPMSGSRIKVAGRFLPCVHMGCFDLNTFVELNQRIRKWQCPICLKNYSLEDLVIDPYFNVIAAVMNSYGDDISEVEMRADGQWRPKLEGDSRFNEPWRTSDGSLVSTDLLKSRVLGTVRVKEELQDQTSHKLRCKRTFNGQWYVDREHNTYSGTSNSATRPIQRQKTSLNSRSISKTDSDEGQFEEEEKSVNQESMGGDLDNDGDSSSGHVLRTSSLLYDNPPIETDIIVLSDSDDDGGALNCNQFKTLRNYESDAVGYTSDNLNAPNLSVAEQPQPGNLISTISVSQSPLAIGDHAPLSIQGDQLQPGGSTKSMIGLAMEAIPSPRNIARPPPVGTKLLRLLGPSRSSTTLDEFHLSPVSDLVYGMPSQQQTDSCTFIANGSGYGSPLEYQQDPHLPNYYDVSNKGVRDSVATESSLRLFLPAQPARPSDQLTAQAPLLDPGEELDNSWFSLSLGGSDNILESCPVNTFKASSSETTPGFVQGRESLYALASTASALLGLSSNGAEMASTNSYPRTQRSGSNPSRYSFNTQGPRNRGYFRIDSDSE